MIHEVHERLGHCVDGPLEVGDRSFICFFGKKRFQTWKGLKKSFVKSMVSFTPFISRWVECMAKLDRVLSPWVIFLLLQFRDSKIELTESVTDWLIRERIMTNFNRLTIISWKMDFDGRGVGLCMSGGISSKLGMITVMMMLLLMMVVLMMMMMMMMMTWERQHPDTCGTRRRCFWPLQLACCSILYNFI